jgi:hypothetical protein
MVWLFIVLSAVSVFLIAALTIGREARRLDALSPRAVYEIEQATEFVAERLPRTTQSRLTMDELSQLLMMHMNWLHSKGLLPERVIDRKQDIDDEVVISEETLVGYLLGEADRAGVEILDDVDIVTVTDVHLQYFEAIGAVGPRAAES